MNSISTSGNPKLSVLMTVFNGMPYLADSVQSILDQDFRDFEFVIVDDGSTDETAKFLKSVNDPRIVYLYQTNGGTAAAANFGLEKCRGEFLARMDADDIAISTRFGKQIRFLEANTTVGMLGSQVIPLGDKRVGKSLHLPTTHGEIVDCLLQGKHALSHPSLMMRTELLRRIGGYWDLRLVDDWDMMLRMSEITEIRNLDEVLLQYRVHCGSLNGAKMRHMRFSIDYARESAMRRREHRPEISHQEYQSVRDKRSLLVKAGESMDIFARSQYRLATAEILGNSPARGYCRLAVAAASQPMLTCSRLWRIVRSKLGGSTKQPVELGTE